MSDRTRHGIAEPPLSERTKEREILSHLGGGRSAASRQFIAGNGVHAALRGLLEESEILGESADRAVGDAFHEDEWGLVNSFTS